MNAMARGFALALVVPLLACGSSDSPGAPDAAKDAVAPCDPPLGSNVDAGASDARRDGPTSSSDSGTIDTEGGLPPPAGRFACGNGALFCPDEAAVGLRCCKIKMECWDPAVDPSDYCDRPYCK